MRLIQKNLLALILFFALSACGFQLRGETQLPTNMKRVHIGIADQFSPLARELSAALKRAGAVVENQSGEGIAEISIPTHTIQTDVLSVSDAARVQEFIVRYRLELNIIGSDGKALLSQIPIELSREFSYDQTQALGAANEEALIKKELQRDMLRAVMNRISAIKRE